ncbi:retrotransposon protein, putative, ty1-copia subclass [Tanacetum coccineum]
MHNMGKTIGELHALLIEYEKGLPKNAATPQVLAIHGGRIQNPNKKPQATKSKKRIGKLNHDRLLKSTDSESFDQCVFYLSEFATRILNMVPTTKIDKTPYELWYGKVPNLSYLKIWGCDALVKRDTPDKLQQRSVKCIFVGYPKETMGYYFYIPPENKIVVASEHLVEAESFEPPQEYVAPVRRSIRTHRAPEHLCLNVEVEEHKMQSMKDNQVWRLVDLPPNAKTVGSKWLFKKKTDMDGNVHTYKARLIAKGYTQTYGIDYEETFSHVAYIISIRILIAIATNTKDMFLVYGGNPKAELRVTCYYDGGIETYRDDIKSQIGYVFILNGGVVDWKSSKQSTTSKSTTEV